MWRFWGLVRHRKQQFSMPVRMKKTQKYEKFYKCENSSSKNIDSEIEDFTIENPIVNACYFDRFLPAHFVGKFAWFCPEIRMFERTFHAFINFFIFFMLAMSRQSPEPPHIRI